MVIASLPAPVRRDLALAVVLPVAAACGMAWAAGWGVGYVAKVAVAMAVAVALFAQAWAASVRAGAAAPAAMPAGPATPQDLGPAHRVTLLRLALAMLLAGVLGEPHATYEAYAVQAPGGPPAPLAWLPWALLGVAALAAALDALDGPLARRSGRASPLGARFDMECDAWFTLVLSALVWQFERAGAWVLLSGAMRYAFVAATCRWPWLGRPLPPSRRRQAVCVVQIAVLVLALAPVVPSGAASALCAFGLALLAASFGADVWRLVRARREPGPGPDPMGPAPGVDPSAPSALPATPGSWLLRFVLAALVLNTLLTFESRLDGMGVHWSPRLSFELCVGLLVLLGWVSRRGPPGARALSWLACGFTALVVLRYADVTVPAFFGRPVNLYWDAPHVWQLASMAWATWSPAVVLGAGAAVLLVLGSVTFVARASLAALAECLLARPRVRPWLVAGVALLGASFVAYPFVSVDTRWFFSLPVTPVAARQVQVLAQALSRERTEARLTPSPSFEGDLGGLRGADVLLLFAESYGMATFERPAQARALAAPRERLAQALQLGGRQVVSARVRSPTFGGASWLAHAALLAGVDTQDPNHYDLLLTTKRPTLVSHFARHGYRTVGWMPGMQRPWPEGRFYGFERYADAHGVGYTGPDFGYWRIPDQAAMALLHAQELGAAGSAASATSATRVASATPRAPRFVVFPTLQTHAPFHPMAPYQPRWDRLLTREAYSPAEVADALAPTGPPGGWVGAYVGAVAHTFAWLGDYLAGKASPDLLTIVIGDHQPLAAVAGAGATWDVPVHVISTDAALLQRLRDAGFVSGLVPGPSTLGGMHELTGLLVRAFEAPGVDVAGTGARRQ